MRIFFKTNIRMQIKQINGPECCVTAGLVERVHIQADSRITNSYYWAKVESESKDVL